MWPALFCIYAGALALLAAIDSAVAQSDPFRTSPPRSLEPRPRAAPPSRATADEAARPSEAEAEPVFPAHCLDGEWTGIWFGPFPWQGGGARSGSTIEISVSRERTSAQVFYSFEGSGERRTPIAAVTVAGESLSWRSERTSQGRTRITAFDFNCTTREGMQLIAGTRIETLDGRANPPARVLMMRSGQTTTTRGVGSGARFQPEPRPAAPAAADQIFDGTWVGRISCGVDPVNGAPAYVAPHQFAVSNGLLTFSRSWNVTPRSAAGTETGSATVGSDGNIALDTVNSLDGRVGGRYRGQFAGGQFTGSGAWYRRACTLLYARETR